MHPIEKFKTWYQDQLEHDQVSIPSACCLSTIGLDGYPNARFVSLKEIVKETFIITGPLRSRKGLEIARNPQVSLAFWWPETERQIRIQGNAHLIDDEAADGYFKHRNRDANIISLISNQGASLADEEQFVSLFRYQQSALSDAEIRRPDHWGGFAITPLRIELMTFRRSRFHHRELYERTNEDWIMTTLQP